MGSLVYCDLCKCEFHHASHRHELKVGVQGGMPTTFLICSGCDKIINQTITSLNKIIKKITIETDDKY